MARLAVQAARLRMGMRTILVVLVQIMSQLRAVAAVLPLVLLRLGILPRPHQPVRRHQQAAEMAEMAV